LSNWNLVIGHEPSPPITKDYQDYIAKLPATERKVAGMIQFFEDGTGQHAITIVVGLKGTWWRHILIYDKGNKRINTIKYASGAYRS
jgi:hypothetical protein